MCLCLIGLNRCQGPCRSFWRAGAQCEELEGEALYKLLKVFSEGEAFPRPQSLVQRLSRNTFLLLKTARDCLLQASKQLRMHIDSALPKQRSLALNQFGATLALPAADVHRAFRPASLAIRIGL